MLWTAVSQRHMIANLRMEKLNLQRSQNNVLLYGCSCLDTSLLNTYVAVDPNPPVVEKTNGQKESNSISRMRSLNLAEELLYI